MSDKAKANLGIQERNPAKITEAA